MNKWQQVKLNDCCASISDGDHQAPPKSESGIPFVTISNIDCYNSLDFSNVMYVPQMYYDKLDNKRKAQKGDIIYSVVGSFGIPVLIKDNTPFVFQRHIAILKPGDDLDSRFLYYTMLNKDFYHKADAVAIGAAQRTISLTALRNLEISLPPIEVQRKIADVLSAYDDLIENNRKQIKLLEESAQRLYKEWFIDLRFPGYENTKIINGIPEGWEKKTVGQLLNKFERTKQVQAADYLETGLLPIIDQSQNFITGYTNDAETLIQYSQPIIVFGDHTRILKLISFPFAKGADGTQIIVSNDSNMPQHLFFCSLREIDLSNYHYARHFKYLKAEEILVPTKKIAQKIEMQLSYFFTKIQQCRNVIIKSESARNILLPKLMNGEFEVK